MEPFRILILGDFAAREHRGGADPSSLASRRMWRVDRDDLDAAIAGIAPELHVAIEPGAAPIVVRIGEIDDFHPDHLLERVADFQRLRALRRQLADPANAPPPSTERSPRAPSAESAAANLAGGSVLDMILAGESTAPGVPPTAPRDELSDFVRQAVRPHVVSERTADQQTLIAQVDDVISATMRIVLHHPRFQAAESLWRGVSFLVRRLDTDESLQVYVVDVTKSELAAAVGALGDAPGRAIRKLMRGEDRPGPWSLLVGAYELAPDETPLVASIAAAARDAGVPWISSANARFAGVSSFTESADPDDWDTSALPGWEAFRRTADARSIALALPRFLLRVPYGARSDECSAIRFEETDDGQLAHGHYLWGNPAFLCALLVGEAAASGDDSPTHGTVGGLPLYVATVDGLPEVTPCAEALLGQRAIAELLDRGLTGLATERDGDSIRIPRLQSTALPAAPLASPVTAEE